MTGLWLYERIMGFGFLLKIKDVSLTGVRNEHVSHTFSGSGDLISDRDTDQGEWN